MKKNLLLSSMLLLILGGSSCKKNQEAIASDSQMEIAAGRGVIGADGGAVCEQPVLGTLLIEKNAQNNWYTDYVGDVAITNDADSIRVTYTCIDDNVLKEVRVWAGQYADAPVNKPGMPEFGHFLAEKTGIPNLTSYTIAMPMSALGATKSGIVVAHANTYKHNTESAWGTGKLFVEPGGKAKYMSYNACDAAPEVVN